jgi:biopolymer transport protein ExbD
MSVSVEPQGKGGKRSLNANLNLVPYIDLLTCMVAFLLITAVWTQLAQLKIAQKGKGGDVDVPPPTTKIAVLVQSGDVNVVVNQDRDVVPDKNGSPDWGLIADLLKKAKLHFPDKEDVEIASADNVMFDRLTGVMDAAIASGFPSVSLVPSAESGL